MSGLEVGKLISISPITGPELELPAAVREITPPEVLLELAKPLSHSGCREGEVVRIQYWEETILYSWDANVINILGPDKKRVCVSIRGEGVTLQRRKSIRYESKVPFSFTVIDAARSRLIGEKVVDVEARDISVGGLKFETGLPLAVGDKLAVHFRFDSFASMPTQAVACVGRSQPVPDRTDPCFSIALHFLQMRDREQHQLLQFLAQMEVGH